MVDNGDVEQYEPEAFEIREQAKNLGIDLETEKRFFWIAKKSLQADAP